MTRPDLAFAAHLLLRFLIKPSLVHSQTAKHALRYIRGTEDVGITYWRNSDAHLTGWTDRWTTRAARATAKTLQDTVSATGVRNLVKVIKIQATFQRKVMCLKQLLDCREIVKL